MKRLLLILLVLLATAGCTTKPDPYCPGGDVIISPFPCPSGRCVVFNKPAMNQEQYDALVAKAAAEQKRPSLLNPWPLPEVKP